MTITKNNTGSTIVVALLSILILAVLGFGGYYVWHTRHETTQTPFKVSATNPQKYVTISQWGVRVPYQGDDTLTASAQTCYTTDTPDIGCWVTLTSQTLAAVPGSCGNQNLAKGAFGYIERETATENYSYTNGSGSEPAAQYATKIPGQYSLVGSEYYFFAPLGNASGRPVTGAPGCAAWDAQFNNEQTVLNGLIAKFAPIPAS